MGGCQSKANYELNTNKLNLLDLFQQYSLGCGKSEGHSGLSSTLY